MSPVSIRAPSGETSRAWRAARPRCRENVRAAGREMSVKAARCTWGRGGRRPGGEGPALRGCVVCFISDNSATPSWASWMVCLNGSLDDPPTPGYSHWSYKLSTMGLGSTGALWVGLYSTQEHPGDGRYEFTHPID